MKIDCLSWYCTSVRKYLSILQICPSHTLLKCSQHASGGFPFLLVSQQNIVSSFRNICGSQVGRNGWDGIVGWLGGMEWWDGWVGGLGGMDGW